MDSAFKKVKSGKAAEIDFFDGVQDVYLRAKSVISLKLLRVLQIVALPFLDLITVFQMRMPYYKSKCTALKLLTILLNFDHFSQYFIRTNLSFY